MSRKVVVVSSLLSSMSWFHRFLPFTSITWEPYKKIHSKEISENSVWEKIMQPKTISSRIRNITKKTLSHPKNQDTMLPFTLNRRLTTTNSPPPTLPPPLCDYVLWRWNELVFRSNMVLLQQRQTRRNVSLIVLTYALLCSSQCSTTADNLLV